MCDNTIEGIQTPIKNLARGGILMSEHKHIHIDEFGNVMEHCHHHDPNDVTDYNEAVNAYRKTFPNKQRVIDETPDPAVKAMLLRMEQLGIDNAFDRFDKQQPQCNFGLAGICCRICQCSPRSGCTCPASHKIGTDRWRRYESGRYGGPARWSCPARRDPPYMPKGWAVRR